MRSIKILAIVLFYCAHTQIYGLSGTLDSFKNIGNTIATMGEAFAQQGGVVPGNQVYGFQVFNNSTATVTPYLAKVKMILGAPTDGGRGDSVALPPNTNSGSTFYGAHLYFRIKIPEADFSEDHLQLGYPNDPNVYLYNVYENQSGVHGEVVGSNPKAAAMASDFTGMIYNGSSSVFPLTYVFSTTAAGASLETTVTLNNSITIPLEPDVFHTLKSQDNFLLRPSVFKYPGGSLPIAFQGIGSVSRSSLVPTQTVVSSLACNYEVLPNNKLVQTGFGVGNFKQATNGKMRNINPIHYTIWNPSGADLNLTTTAPTATLIPFPSNTLTAWALYTGSVYSVKQQKIIDKPLIKIPSGKAVSFYIVRPPVSRQKDMLYIFNVTSPDDVVAQDLLKQFFSIPIPRFTSAGLSFANPTGNYTYKLPDGINSTNVFTLFNTPLPDKAGSFTKGNACAYVVFQKTFSSYSPSIAPQFCTLRPPSYDPTNISLSVLQFLDPVKMTGAAQQQLIPLITQWVDAYKTDPAALKTQIQQYLLQNGTSSMIDSSGPTPVLSSVGNMALSMIMQGPCSISNLPLLYGIASNVSLEPPSPWVSSANVILF
jgi:hypothetical protein